MICVNTKVYLVIRKRYQSPIMKYTSNLSNSLKYRDTKFHPMKLNSPTDQDPKNSATKLLDSSYHSFNPLHKFNQNSKMNNDDAQLAQDNIISADNYKHNRNIIRSASASQISQTGKNRLITAYIIN